MGFFDYYPLYRGTNLATVEWVVIKSEGDISFLFAFFLSVILHTNVVLFSFCINIIIKNTYNINCVDYEPCFLLTSNSDHVSPLLNACRVSVSC